MAEQQESRIEADRQQRIAKEAAQEAVRATFRELGYDPDHIEDIRTLQMDLAWVRGAREKGDQIGGYVRKATITGLIGAFLYAIWLGVKTKLGS